MQTESYFACLLFVHNIRLSEDNFWATLQSSKCGDKCFYIDGRKETLDSGSISIEECFSGLVSMHFLKKLSQA